MRIADGARVIVALGVALLWFVALPPPEERSAASISDGAALAAVLEALENSDLDEEAKEAAEKVGPGAAGDTCFMRYAGLPFSTDRPTRERFARAAALTDPDRKLAALEALAVGGEAHQTWRARYGQAVVALRTGNAEQASDYLSQAAAVPSMPPICRADESYLKALLASSADTALAALLQAFDQDRGSWGIASALALRLPDSAAAGMGCERAASHLIRAVVQLSHLTRSDSQLARLSRAVSGGTEQGDSIRQILARLLIGLIAERSNHPDDARATYTDGLALARARPVCGTALPAFFESRIAALQEKTAP